MSCIFNEKIASCNIKKVTFAMLMLHQQSTTYNRSKPIKTTAFHGLTPSSFGYVPIPIYTKRIVICTRTREETEET